MWMPVKCVNANVELFRSNIFISIRSFIVCITYNVTTCDYEFMKGAAAAAATTTTTITTTMHNITVCSFWKWNAQLYKCWTAIVIICVWCMRAPALHLALCHVYVHNTFDFLFVLFRLCSYSLCRYVMRTSNKHIYDNIEHWIRTIVVQRMLLI